MNVQPDIVISVDDARTLSALLDGATHQAAEMLAEVFGGAEIVEAANLPPGVVPMNAPVQYVEVAKGAVRNITLVSPAEADPALGRISVLSPVGRALLGRAVGMVSKVELPNDQTIELKITNVEPVVDVATA
ncbi:MAG TPA: GreA/GreB family elongation factor [Burkholderiales bacterium]